MIPAVQFMDTFRANATQLATPDLAAQWLLLSGALAAEGIILTAEQAARWASTGHMPAEAAPLIRDGVTGDTAGELDQLATDIAGGHEQRAAQMVDELVADGTLVDPTSVRQVQDPDDPDHIIVYLHPNHPH